MKGTTSTGFEYSIKPEALDDWETFELLDEMNNGNEFAIARFIKRILGGEQMEKLKEHCRVDGVVRTSKMQDEIMEILTATKQAKNS